MKVVLIGFATSYKTSAGKQLAEMLKCDFYDTDCEVEKATGQSIAEIFRTRGEEAFRVAEESAVQSLADKSGVVACGGGTPLCKVFDSLCKNAVVVWLKTSPQCVFNRLERGTRPLFDNLSLLQLQQKIADREIVYRHFANAVVQTDGKTSRQVAEEIFSLLK